MALPSAILQRGTRAAQPAASSVAEGVTYYVTDEMLTEQSVSGTWQPYSASGSASGDVIGPASSVDKELALFDGTSGKLLEAATGTGYVKVTAGVLNTPASTVPVADGGTNLSSYTAGDLLYATGGTTLAKLPIGTAAQVLTVNGGATAPAWAAAAGGGGVVVQMVSTQTGAVATGTGVLPFDDTIPQNTEGDEYMTLAITPTNAAHKLRIEVVIFLANTAGSRNKCAALFQDTTANALACGYLAQLTANFTDQLSFIHHMTAGTTSSTTFKVRAGTDTGGTNTINGTSSARRYGGTLASSITITEYVP